MSRVQNKWVALLLALVMVCLPLGGSMVALAEGGVGQVTGLSAWMASANRIGLSWNPINNVSGYQLWRSSNRDSGYSSMKSLTSNTTDNAYSLGYGETVYYKVRAYRLTESGERVYGEFSAPVAVKNSQTAPKAEKVTGLTGSMSSSSQIKLSWNKQSQVSGYQLWRSTTSPTDGFTGVKSLTANSTVNGYSLQPGKSVYYKVRAYVNVGGERVYGEFSDPVTIRNGATSESLGKVENVIAQLDGGKVKLTWARQSVASGYQLMYATAPNGELKGIKSIVKNVTSDSTGLIPGAGQTYYYYVRAFFVEGDGTRTYGPFSNPVAVKNGTGSDSGSSSTAPAKVQNLVVKLDANGRAQLTWNKQPGVSGYQLMYATTPNGELKGIKSLTKNVGSDSTGVAPAAGQTYYYRVRAFVTGANGARTYGDFSDAAAVSNTSKPLQVGKVTGMSGKATANRVQLSWNKVAGANGYQVWRSTTGINGTYTGLKSIAGTATDNAYSVQVGETVYYKVRAYVNQGGTRVYGEFSDPLGVSQTGTATTVTKVTGLQGAMANANTITLSWTAQAGVRGYQIWRSELPTSGFVNVKSVDTNQAENSYTLPYGSSVFFKVRAFTDDANGNRIHGEFSDVLEVRNGPLATVPSVVTGVKGEVKAKGEISLTWDKQPGVSGYQLWRSTDPNTGYIGIKSIVPNINSTVNSYEIGFNQTVYYKVRAFVDNAAGERVYGPFSEPAAVRSTASASDIGKVQNFTAKLDANSAKITMTWTLQPKATGYQLMYSTSLTGPMNGIKSTGKNVATDTTTMMPKPGQTWYYRLRAYLEDGKGNRIYGEFSDPVEISVMGTPQNLKVEAATDKAFQLTWSPVANANGYLVYYSTAENGPYTMVQTVTGAGTALTLNNAQPSTTYYFKVGAYRMEGKTQMRGPLSAAVSVKTADGIKIVAKNHYNRVNLSWGNVAAYHGYVVYRKTAGVAYALVNGTLGYNGSEWTFVDATAIPNNNYTYSVVGYTEQNGVRTYGAVGAYTANVSTYLPSAAINSALPVAGSASSNTVQLRWKDMLDITHYEVQYSALPTTGFTSLITVQDPNPETALSYLSYNQESAALAAGKTYYFRVRPCVMQGGATYYGGWSGVTSTYIPSITARDTTVGNNTQAVLLYVANTGNQNMSISGGATYYPLGKSYDGLAVTGSGGTLGVGGAGNFVFTYTDGASHLRNSNAVMDIRFSVDGRSYAMTVGSGDTTSWRLQ